jgi:hypothetical protein
MPTRGTTAESTGFRALQRRITDTLAQAQPVDPEPASLESRRTSGEAPRTAQARPIEGGAIIRRAIPGPPDVGFAAFLDGMQVSRIVAHDDGIPIVFGEVAAVVRERVDRRMKTWRAERETRLYAPRAFLSPAGNEAVEESITIIDTTPRTSAGEPDPARRHPLSLNEVAVHSVQEHREALEIQLAEAWIGERSEPIYIDGGISGSSRAASSANAVGVVKNHRTLYGDTAALREILALDAGERSSVFEVSAPNRWRSTVASWYLRLRRSADPLWGLVRIEVCHPEQRGSASEVQAPGDARDDQRPLTARADQVSRWVLAETAPLALPDGQWDTMAYGVRDCRQYLKAILH